MKSSTNEWGHAGFVVRGTVPVTGPLWPAGAREVKVSDHGAAVALAAKSRIAPGGTIEVLHARSGEVVFRKQMGLRAPDDALFL
jgi:hypothetical protein